MRGDEFTPVPTDGESEEPEPKPERLISIKETQSRLADITRREVYNRIKAGDLTACKIGRRVGVLEASVDDYIRRQLEESQVAA